MVKFQIMKEKRKPRKFSEIITSSWVPLGYMLIPKPGVGFGFLEIKELLNNPVTKY